MTLLILTAFVNVIKKGLSFLKESCYITTVSCYKFLKERGKKMKPSNLKVPSKTIRDFNYEAVL